MDKKAPTRSPRCRRGALRSCLRWLPVGLLSQSGAPSGKILFAQVLECDLDAFVVELLIVGAKLLAAIRGAIEELYDPADRGMRFPFKLGRAADVNRAVEIKVVDVVIELANQQSRHGLVANAKHFRACADWGYVLVTPANFVIETETGNRCAVGVETDTLRS